MSEWLDDNCGVGGWSITPAGTRGVFNDAIAVYVNIPTCAVGLVARWLIPGDPCAMTSRRGGCLDRRTRRLDGNTERFDRNAPREGVVPGSQVLDPNRRMRCRESDEKGRAVVSIRWLEA